MRTSGIFAFCCLAFTFALFGAQEENIGVRPYEMDWAERTEEVGPTILDFETFGDWTVETENAVASFTQSRAEQMYGDYVAKLVYRQADENDKTAPVVRILRKEPIALTQPFDSFSVWIVGNIWAWEQTSTPWALVSLLFETADGSPYAVPVERIRWKEWFLSYHHLKPTQIADLNKPGTVFRGFKIEQVSNLEDREIYIDSLRIFKEEFAPLEFSKRPKRNLELFEGQDPGQNTGEGTLPFPTRPETILPTNKTSDFKNTVVQNGDTYELIYEGTDGKLVYTYAPSTGSWSDFVCRWNDSAAFLPLAGGGVTALIGEGNVAEKIESGRLDGAALDGHTLTVRWNLKSATSSATVEYRFAIAGKNLILDTLCAGGRVEKVAFGRVEKIQNARNVLIPYYSYGYANRPAALVFDLENVQKPLFALGNIDWYRSGASNLRGLYEVGNDFGVTNGAAEYNPKTDGKRNDVFERFVFTVSDDFTETLPNIANPISPWKHVTGKGVWRAHGASERQTDKDYWYNVWRHGMRHLIVTDHETCWRDGGESFTFRTRPAPKKGGDAGWVDYSAYMQKTLGFVYGPYNNFTDFAPVNEYWSPDMVSRTSSNDLQQAWTRCYAPKPSRAVEYCEKLSPINEAKFHFSTAYCDVHSAVTPWSRTDYDVRTPGAGTFAAVYYPYGEIMLLQKAAWDGPVYSEGPHHCFYAGLTDGNYAQDQAYRFMTRPWLVDFDLLKMHPLECDFGMGNLEMFAPGYTAKDDAQREAFLDRFLTATIAFGHPGFLTMDFGVSGAMRGYCMVEQIASRYTLSDVESIRYADDNGDLFGTSDAISTNVYADNRLVVRYKDGTTVIANGSPIKMMNVAVDGKKIVLPPNGYEAFSADGAIHVASKNDDNGNRFDYCQSPEYIYFDSRKLPQKLPLACGSGQAVCRILDDGKFEIILMADAKVGFKIDANRAVALDFKNNELGEAVVKKSRGYTFVEPVEGAFSYRLEKTSDSTTDAGLDCERFVVVPGETVTVIDTADSSKKFDVTLPADIPVNTLYTAEPTEGKKIDFAVVPFCGIKIGKTDSGPAKVTIRCNKPDTAQLIATVLLGEKTTETSVPLHDGVGKFTLALDSLTEGETPLVVTAAAQGISQKVEWKIKTVLEYPTIAFDFGDTPEGNKPQIFMQVRSQTPTGDLGDSGAYVRQEGGVTCGGVVKLGLAAHPPYMNGAGRVWAEYTVALPSEPAILTAQVGKRDGSDQGDGIWFSAVIVEADGTEKTLGETAVTDFGWRELTADLSEYAGKTVTLRLIADCGPADNTTADWAAIAETRLRGRDKKLISTIEN